MTVFVDDWNQRALVGRLNAVWCHMTVAPFDPIEELHDFAVSIGLRRSWFQGPPKNPWPRMHYDVTATKRAAAVAAGAREITWRRSGQHVMWAKDACRQAAADIAGNELQESRRDLPALVVPGSLLWVTAKAWYELTEARTDLEQSMKEQGYPHGH